MAFTVFQQYSNAAIDVASDNRQRRAPVRQCSAEEACAAEVAQSQVRVNAVASLQCMSMDWWHVRERVLVWSSALSSCSQLHVFNASTALCGIVC